MRWTKCVRKVVDFLSILLFFWGKTLSFFDESRVFVFRSSLPVFFLTRVGVPERTRARASRTQRVWNSCLHPSPSPLMVWYIAGCGWRWSAFFSFTGEENWGEAFTRKALFINWLSSMGEEVKAKNEKRRKRAYTRVRWGEEVDVFENGERPQCWMDCEMAVNRLLSVFFCYCCPLKKRLRRTERGEL